MTGEIAGVELTLLPVFEDARGAVLRMFRGSGDDGDRIAEVYFSEIRWEVVKGWKRHRKMTQRMAVPVGRVRFALHDDREGSATRGRTLTFELGRPDCYSLLIIPPGVWYSFKGLASGASLIANCSDLIHRDDEVDQLPLGEGVSFFAW